MHDIGAVYHYRTPDKSNPNVIIDRNAARVTDGSDPRESDHLSC